MSQNAAKIAEEYNEAKGSINSSAEEVEKKKSEAADALAAAKQAEEQRKIAELRLATVTAEMRLAEVEDAKIMQELTELTEQQVKERSRMLGIAAEIVRTEEQTASADFEAAQAKLEFEAARLEKEKLNLELNKELQELEELHGDLHSTQTISGSVQRELEQTKMGLSAAQQELNVVLDRHTEDTPEQQLASLAAKTREKQELLFAREREVGHASIEIPTAADSGRESSMSIRGQVQQTTIPSAACGNDGQVQEPAKLGVDRATAGHDDSVVLSPDSASPGKKAAASSRRGFLSHARARYGL